MLYCTPKIYTLKTFNLRLDAWVVVLIAVAALLLTAMVLAIIAELAGGQSRRGGERTGVTALLPQRAGRLAWYLS